MRNIAILLVTAYALLGTPASAKTISDFPDTPSTNSGQKWRIAYYEGGQYIDYRKTFTETVRGLMRLGWIELAYIPTQRGEQAADLWKWLSTHARSEYLEFVPDAHYSANWNETLRAQTVATLMDRLNGKGDIDLLIAMGTWAGKDFASTKHSTPTMVLSASDPVSAGIIKSVDDSGFGHVHATVYPNRHERQLRVFHEIMGFETLGVAYEDSVQGRGEAAIDFVEKVAGDRDFEVVHCHTVGDSSDVRMAEQSVVACFRELADKVDAIYVTPQRGVNRRSIPGLVRLTHDKGIPTFSQSGSEEVRLGFLVSLASADLEYIGTFHARNIAKVLSGASPGQLKQLLEEPSKISINLKTAELIGFDPPLVLIGAANEIFHTIADAYAESQ